MGFSPPHGNGGRANAYSLPALPHDGGFPVRAQSLYGDLLPRVRRHGGRRERCAEESSLPTRALFSATKWRYLPSVSRGSPRQASRPASSHQISSREDLEKTLFMRRKKDRRSGAAQTIEPSERPNAHDRVLRGERLVERQYRRGSQVQRVAQRHVAALLFSGNLAARRLDSSARKLQQLRYAGIFFPDDSNNRTRRRGGRELGRGAGNSHSETQSASEFRIHRAWRGAIQRSHSPIQSENV